jgi:Holliday junction resolvase RusA-like endonuclease
MIVTIPGELPDFNSELDFAKRHWSYYAAHKKQWTNLVRYHFTGKKLPTPSALHFHWYCKNKKKDPDNIAFAKKYILDGIVAAGALPNDGWDEVAGLQDSFTVDKDNPRVEVEIV